MNASVLDRAEAPKAAEDKGGADAWNDCRSWLSARPESATKCSDSISFAPLEIQKATEKNPTKETPEVKAAYAEFLERTKGLDPKSVADSITFTGDLAASGLRLPLSTDQSAKAEAKKAEATDGKMEPNGVTPLVSDAYQGLMARGFNPEIIVDALRVAGDVAQIVMSPQGQKLITDIKTLISHLRG